MKEWQTIRYEVGDHLATIELARPDKRNAMNRFMFEELGSATEEAANDPAVRVVVLKGEGSSFCAGIDLAQLAELAGIEASRLGEFVDLAQRPYRMLATMPKPTIAAVQGHAIGAGFQLALACDLRILADDAGFAMLEVRYGLIPDLGGPHRLAALVGPARAKELIWTGRTVAADEALSLGLAERLVPADELPEVADSLAADLLRHSPTALRRGKTLVDRAPMLDLDQHLAEAGRAQAEAIGGPDHAEAVAAFFERRDARFP
jgi:enoyl-CoA hydratase/carnithine racemase